MEPGTSQVSGELAPPHTPVDVLRATLPAGTVSGAPKVRAMEIIDDLEPVKRGPYAGVIGYFDFSGNLDTATSREILTLLGNLPEQGKRAVVMVTHDPSGAKYGTRLVTIRDGLLESDEPVIRN